MILPDVNVLLYAFRSDSAAHPAYRSWLAKIINSDEAYGISPKVLCSVVRESTHQGIHVRPSRLDDALAFARVMLGQATCNVIEPGDRHWSIFEDLSRRVPAAGNLVRDAWFAAPAIEPGCEWITTDRDYARFPGLRWRPPF